MSEEIKLLPCPFCGGDATLRDDHPDPKACRWVECQNCGVEHTTFVSSAEAIAAWNTRAHDGDGWRDIESAPKDGTPFLCLINPGGRGRRVTIGQWENQRFHRNPQPYFKLREPFGTKWDRDNQPELWMPFPAPPQSTLEQEKRG